MRKFLLGNAAQKVRSEEIGSKSPPLQSLSCLSLLALRLANFEQGMSLASLSLYFAFPRASVGLAGTEHRLQL